MSANSFVPTGGIGFSTMVSEGESLRRFGGEIKRVIGIDRWPAFLLVAIIALLILLGVVVFVATVTHHKSFLIHAAGIAERVVFVLPFAAL